MSEGTVTDPMTLNEFLDHLGHLVEGDVIECYIKMSGELYLALGIYKDHLNVRIVQDGEVYKTQGE
jgi:hypothetical protein